MQSNRQVFLLLPSNLLQNNEEGERGRGGELAINCMQQNIQVCSAATASITNNVIVGPLSVGFPAIALYNDDSVTMSGNVLLNAASVCERKERTRTTPLHPLPPLPYSPSFFLSIRFSYFQLERCAPHSSERLQ